MSDHRLVEPNWLPTVLCFLLLADQFSQIFSQQNTGHERRYSKPEASQIVKQRLTRDALLPCKLLSKAADLEIRWWHKAVGDHLIGTFNTSTSSVAMNWTRDDAYRIMNNGTLKVTNVRRELVERYECSTRLADGSEARDAIYLRLDFSFWYSLEPFSLFYGSWLAAVIACAASFILNIIWIGLRWIVLRWIKRTERLTRVRSMLLAMEKYRQKQMESLHESYSRRVSAIRDNYHSQMEAFRHSYAESAEQISRLREFGSRRVEQLWESYDRSLHAVRTFTTEQRNKMLKQYKVKQRYVNKLLEAIATETNVDVISRKEAAIRDALGEEGPPSAWASCSVQTSTAGHVGKVAIPRSASYYSLPEFVMDGHHEEEEEQQRQLGTGADGQSMQQKPCTSADSSNCTRVTRVHFLD